MRSAQSIIFVVVLLGVVIDAVQTHRSQQAAQKLRQRVAPTATVLRDGAWSELPRREVVPGDIIRLSAGDLVPADAPAHGPRPVRPTGRSHGRVAAGRKARRPGSRRTSSSWNVRRQRRCDRGGLRDRIGDRIGDIVARLAAKPPETDFDRGTRHFGHLILKTVFVLTLFVFLVNAVRGRARWSLCSSPSPYPSA